MTAATNPPGTAEMEAELRALMEKATPGPIILDERFPFCAYADDATGSLLARFGGSPGFEFVNTISDAHQQANAALWAAAINALPALLDALAAQREELREANEAVLELQRDLCHTQGMPMPSERIARDAQLEREKRMAELLERARGYEPQLDTEIAALLAEPTP